VCFRIIRHCESEKQIERKSESERGIKLDQNKCHARKIYFVGKTGKNFSK